MRSGLELVTPLMEENISGAPLPKARNVTPAMLLGRRNVFDIVSKAGQRLHNKSIKASNSNVGLIILDLQFVGNDSHR